MIPRILARLNSALDAVKLARTVRIMARQLDHAHLAGRLEEARADRAEERADLEFRRAQAYAESLVSFTDGARTLRDRIAELENQIQDWREASGELAAEQAADLPDLEPADDSGPPSPLPADPYARAEVQAKRADAAERHRLAAEAHAADLESELATVRAQLQQTERAAGAHLATIEGLRAQIEADRPPRIASRAVRYAAVMKVSAEIDADEPARETQPSARLTATIGEP